MDRRSFFSVMVAPFVAALGAVLNQKKMAHRGGSSVGRGSEMVSPMYQSAWQSHSVDPFLEENFKKYHLGASIDRSKFSFSSNPSGSGDGWVTYRGVPAFSAKAPRGYMSLSLKDIHREHGGRWPHE